MEALGEWSKDVNGTVRRPIGGRAREVLRRMQKVLLSATMNIASTFKVVIVHHHRNCYLHLSLIPEVSFFLFLLIPIYKNILFLF